MSRFASKQEVIDFFVNNNGKMSAMFIDDECKLLMLLKKDNTNRYQFIDKELENLTSIDLCKCKGKCTCNKPRFS